MRRSYRIVLVLSIVLGSVESSISVGAVVGQLASLSMLPAAVVS